MKNTNKSSNNTIYPLRIIAGLYLLYLSYSLLKDWQQLDNKLLFGIFIAIFSGIGLFVLISSVLAYLRNRNSEGMPDETNSEDGKLEETEDKETKLTEVNSLDKSDKPE